MNNLFKSIGDAYMAPFSPEAAARSSPAKIAAAYGIGAALIMVFTTNRN